MEDEGGSNKRPRVTVEETEGVEQGWNEGGVPNLGTQVIEALWVSGSPYFLLLFVFALLM